MGPSCVKSEGPFWKSEGPFFLKQIINDIMTNKILYILYCIMIAPKFIRFWIACQSSKYLSIQTVFWHKIRTVVYNWTQKTILKSIKWNRRYGHIYTHYRIPKYRDGDYDRAEIYTFLNRLSKLQIFVDSNAILTQDRDRCIQHNIINYFEIDRL